MAAKKSAPKGPAIVIEIGPVKKGPPPKSAAKKQPAKKSAGRGR